MKVVRAPNKYALGQQAAALCSQLLSEAIEQNGEASMIIATGTSQFETINALIAEGNVDWSKVTLFHLDEYIGISETHPASFRKYIKERFLAHVPALKATYLIDGEIGTALDALNTTIAQHHIDVALVGIGENGHLAFNDPPADFETEVPYLVVNLDEPCRLQQMGEGWFKTLEEVPLQAVSMSIRQIMKSKHIICSVPDERKAVAVRDCLVEVVNNHYPASILQNHTDCVCFLDPDSASLLPVKSLNPA